MKAPAWCKDAVPSTKGWHHPVTCELLKGQKFTQAQVDAWHGVSEPEPTPEPAPEVVEEDSETEG